MNAERQMRRIHIIGTPGAGKTTLARRLAQRLDLAFVELDALFWGTHWMPATHDVFRRRVGSSVRDGRWVACGNHASVRDLVWARADTVIWLDYPSVLGASRLVGRAVLQMRDWLRGQRASAFGHDSLLLYAFRANAERRADFATLFAKPEYAHLRVLRFRAPRETELWVQQTFGGSESTAGATVTSILR